MSENLVFVRVGRLKYYDDRKDTDGPVGGGSYNEDNYGSEINNFRPIDGRLFGYAQTPSGGGFNLERIPNDGRGATVVMVALAERGIGQVVVGWYRDASLEDVSVPRPRKIDGLWNFQAASNRAVLLPLAERRLAVPKGSGGMGQANVFYPIDGEGRPRRPAWFRKVSEFIRSYRGGNLLRAEDDVGAPPPAPPVPEAEAQAYRMNAAERRAIEEASMLRAIQYFEEAGWIVYDHSRTECYDLLCEREGVPPLRVEVKGTTGTGEKVLVTRNEVESARQNDTALFVVSGLTLHTTKGKLQAKGGEITCIHPWRAPEQDLRATKYEARVRAAKTTRRR